MKQRYLKVNRDLIPVSEDVYLAATRWKENKRYRARRDGKCGQEDYRRCSGDCATCAWQQEGHRLLSLSKLLGDEFKNEAPELTQTAPSFDDMLPTTLLYPKGFAKSTKRTD